jgi:hypothetical protein
MLALVLSAMISITFAATDAKKPMGLPSLPSFPNITIPGNFTASQDAQILAGLSWGLIE